MKRIHNYLIAKSKVFRFALLVTTLSFPCQISLKSCHPLIFPRHSYCPSHPSKSFHLTRHRHPVDSKSDYQSTQSIGVSLPSPGRHAYISVQLQPRESSCRGKQCFHQLWCNITVCFDGIFVYLYKPVPHTALLLRAIILNKNKTNIIKN